MDSLCFVCQDSKVDEDLWLMVDDEKRVFCPTCYVEYEYEGKGEGALQDEEQIQVMLLSDIHIEMYNSCKEWFQKPFMCWKSISKMKPSKICVLAGDITRAINEDGKVCPRMEFIFRTFKSMFDTVLYVPGNHETWQPLNRDHKKNKKSTFFWRNPEQIDKILADACEKEGVIFLQKKTWSYITENGHEWIFVGCTLWSKISTSTFSKMQDYRGVKDWKTYNELHEDHIAWLQKTLYQLDKEKNHEKTSIIVVTHHLPTFSATHPRFQLSSCNDGFASDQDYLMYSYNPLLVHWLAGHTHERVKCVVGGVTVETNPFGYPGEMRATTFHSEPIVIRASKKKLTTCV